MIAALWGSGCCACTSPTSRIVFAMFRQSMLSDLPSILTSLAPQLLQDIDDSWGFGHEEVDLKFLSSLCTSAGTCADLHDFIATLGIERVQYEPVVFEPPVESQLDGRHFWDLHY